MADQPSSQKLIFDAHFDPLQSLQMLNFMVCPSANRHKLPAHVTAASHVFVSLYRVFYSNLIL